jgi:hypothetical protein
VVRYALSIGDEYHLGRIGPARHRGDFFLLVIAAIFLCRGERLGGVTTSVINVSIKKTRRSPGGFFHLVRLVSWWIPRTASTLSVSLKGF